MEIENRVSKNKKGLVHKLRDHSSKPYEKVLYQLPSFSKHIKTEPIPKNVCYWTNLYSNLEKKSNGPILSEEELEKEIENRIDKLTDYFERFESGLLTEEEEKERIPETFRGPYFPTTLQVKFLEQLNIKINFHQLSPLHSATYKMITEEYVAIRRASAECCKMYETEKGGFTIAEVEILLKNWKKFQKKYGFYDLRPLLGILTHRLKRKGTNQLQFVTYHYLSVLEKVKFILYIGRGLPKQSLYKIRFKMISILSSIKNNEICADGSCTSLNEVNMLEMYIKKYGYCRLGIELIMGDRSGERYSNLFLMYLKYKHIPTRFGIWLQAEDIRFLKGIYNVTKAKNIKDLFTERLPCLNVYPYVKTRNVYQLSQHWRVVLSCKMNVKQQVKEGLLKEYPMWTVSDLCTLISFVYKSGALLGSRVNWNEASKLFPHFSLSECRNTFMNFFYSRVPPQKRNDFYEGAKYLYKKVLPMLQKKEIRFLSRGHDLEFIKKLPLPEECKDSLYKDLKTMPEYDEDEDVINLGISDNDFSSNKN